MSIAWPSLREVRGHLQTFLCLSFCWLPLEGTAWDWAKLDLLSEFPFFAQSSRLSFHVNCEDFLLMTTLITCHLQCSSDCVPSFGPICVEGLAWVGFQTTQEARSSYFGSRFYRRTCFGKRDTWRQHLDNQRSRSIFALIQDNVDELDRLARTCLCVSQGLEFDRGKSCWFASPKNDPDLYYHLQSLKSTTSFQKILMMLMMMMMLMTRMMRKKLTNSGDADWISKWWHWVIWFQENYLAGFTDNKRIILQVLKII